MEKRIIDFNSYPRKAHFEYFKAITYPYVGVTVNVDITDFLRSIKKKGSPFFLSFLYEVAHAANAVPEFRQRIVGEDIIEYLFCNTSHTVAKDDGTYAYCVLEAGMERDAFLPYAIEKQEMSKRIGDILEEDTTPLIFVSTLPWLEYTSIVQPVPIPADSNPRITWGKYFTQDGKTVIPVTVLANHALVDGKHLSDFYKVLSERLNRGI